MIHIVAEFFELGSQGWEWEVAWFDKVAIVAKGYRKLVRIVEWRKVRRGDSLHLKWVTATFNSPISLGARTRVYRLGSGNWTPVQAFSPVNRAGKLVGRARTSWFGLAAMV